MQPDEIKSLRQGLGWSQKDLALALDVDVDLVRDWEKGQQFPTKAHCDRMAAFRAAPPPKPKKTGANPLAVMAEPSFQAVVRKVAAHPRLRTQVEQLARDFDDPLADDA